MFKAKPAAISNEPMIQRSGPFTKAVGANLSAIKAAANGRTNNSGGGITIPGRSSFDDKGAGIRLVRFAEFFEIGESSVENVEIHKALHTAQSAARNIDPERRIFGSTDNARKAKGALVSEDALHIEMAVSRILSWMIIYLSDIPED